MKQSVCALVLSLAACVGGFENTPFVGTTTGSVTGRLEGPIDPSRAFVAIVADSARTASVAADGSFTIDGLRRGAHSLVAFTGLGRSAIVEIEIFAERTVTAELHLAAEASIGGRVTIEHGFSATAPPHIAVEELPIASVADSHGTFELFGLPAGCWRLVVTSAGFESVRALVCVEAGARTERLFRLRSQGAHAGNSCSPCTTDAHCGGGLCITAGQERYCTQVCDAHQPCPSGYSCLEVEPGVQACSLPHSSCTAHQDFADRLSCSDDATCGIDGVDDGVCDVSSRCTLSCHSASCPQGSVCVDGGCR